MLSQASAWQKLFVRSCDSTHHIRMSLPVHIIAHCSISIFGVCLRYLSVLRWKNSRICGSLTAPRGGITLTTGAFRSPHCTLSNSYKLVRAPSSLCRHWPPHRSPVAQRPQALCPAHRLHTKCHQSTVSEAATQLSSAEFLERCILFLRASPPRPQPNPTLLLDAATQTFPHSAVSAEASTQLPLAEFFLGRIRRHHPTTAHRVLYRVRLLQ